MSGRALIGSTLFFSGSSLRREARFTGAPTGTSGDMSFALAASLTAGSLAAAALSIAYALTRG